jgi:hypothetical protein
LSELWGTARVSKPRLVSSFLMILALWRRRDSRALHHRERGKIIYGDVSFDPSLKFILAQRRPN